MSMEALVKILLVALLAVAMRHLPRWLARRSGGSTRLQAERERDIRQKLRTTQRLMRMFRRF
jgi:hypothetical protein